MIRSNSLLRKNIPLLKKKKEITGLRRKYRSQFGRRPVLRAIKILKDKKLKYNCPICSYPKTVKRISTARYSCRKCKVSFTSNSYLF